MIVDYDGRILTQATPGPGERIVAAAINLDMLRHERRVRRAHQMMVHLRAEAYPMYGKTFYAGARHAMTDVSITDLEQRIDKAKRDLGYLADDEVGSAGIQSLLDRGNKD